MRAPIEIHLRKRLPALIAGLLFVLAGPIIGYFRYWYWGTSGLHTATLVQLLLFSAPVLFFAVFKIRLKGYWGRLGRIALLPGSALLCLWLWENMAGNTIFRLDGDMLAINYVLMLMLFLAFHVLLGDVRRSVPTAFSVITLAGYAYHCITRFRGTPPLPSDLSAFQTALNVAAHYTYPFDRVHYLAISLCVSLWLFSRTLPKRSDWRIASLLSRLVSLVAVGTAGFLLLNTPILQQLGVSVSQWPEDIPHIVLRCGSIAQFSAHLYGIKEPRPDGYDPATLEEVILLAPQPASLLAQTLDTSPNIIVIMNESFADLNDALGVTTDADPMPFLHSLSENTIKGDLYVSVRGGNTCNTEYEFLTGNALYPNTSSVAFYQIVKHSMPSIAHLLKAQGYTTIAIHPAAGENYNRDTVYSYLGFDTFDDITAFPDADTFRNLVTDRACYDKIRTLYQEKAEDERLFLFNVTMQNHSGYNIGGTQPTVSLTQEVENGDELNEYLRCVRESDAAFAELVEYFAAEEEPTILLFFGDHQPWLDFSGVPGEMAEKTQVKSALRRYVVPYVIWANYDLAEVDIPEISANYLSSVLLSCTGLPLDAYSAYQLDVRKRYPVVTRLGYVDAAGTYTAVGIAPNFPDDLLNLYGAAYNRAYDTKHWLSPWRETPH